MGLGITLGANGLLNELDSEGGGGAQGADGWGKARRADADADGVSGKEAAAGRDTSLAPPVVKVGARCNLVYDTYCWFERTTYYSSLLSHWLQGITYYSSLLSQWLQGITCYGSLLSLGSEGTTCHKQ